MLVSHVSVCIGPQGGLAHRGSTEVLTSELLKVHRGQDPGLAGCEEKSRKPEELTLELTFMGWWELLKLGKEGPRWGWEVGAGLPGPETGKLPCSGNGKWFCVFGLQCALATMQGRSLGPGAQGHGLQK